VPLGASITQGWDVGIIQSLQDGYRKPLRDELRYRGYAVNMVGSRAEGEFIDNQHEGWPGLEIDQVAYRMQPVLTSQKPNLVLILVGSNDCFHAKRDNSMEYARATKDRMKKMIERIYSEVADTTIILATLPPTLDASDELWIKTANSGYKELAQELAKQGRKIELVDTYSTWFVPEDHSDSIHFKPSGYKKLAALFAGTISRVEAKKWLSEPLKTEISDSIGCYPSPGDFHGPVRTQSGSGHDDGDFTYASTFERSKDLEYKQSAPRALLGHFHFANLVKSGNEVQPLDEFIRVLDQEDRAKNNLPFASYHTNKGDANFEQVPVPIDVGQECASQGVRWADINGDGLDDFICLDEDGIPRVSLNRAGTPPTFEFIGAIRDDKIDQSKVRLADVDGDGRADVSHSSYKSSILEYILIPCSSVELKQTEYIVGATLGSEMLRLQNTTETGRYVTLNVLG
jgi:lysophospholipase L1-like esterase